MLGSLEGYIKRRSKTHHTAMRVFFSDSPHPQEEYLDSLWQQIKRLRSEMWIEKHIIRPYLAFDSVRIYLFRKMFVLRNSYLFSKIVSEQKFFYVEGEQK